MSKVSHEHFLAWKRAHHQLRRVRGKASDYECVDCGIQAEEWALRWATPEMLGTRPYSDDVWDYDPKCVKCHNKQDGSADGKISGALAAVRWSKNRDAHRAMTSRGGKIGGPIAGRITSAQRYRCLGSKASGAPCTVCTNPGALSNHQRATGHEGRERIA